MKRIKFIQQPSDKDCGPTCLSIISNYYGKEVSIERLKEYSFTNYTGTSLEGLIKAGTKIGIYLEGFQLDTINELSSQNLPCICHVITKKGMEHFVVIYKITEHHVFYIDPGVGKLKEKKEEFKKKSTNVVLLTNSLGEDFKNANKLERYGILTKIFKNNIKYVFLIIFFSILINIVNIMGALYFKVIVDLVIPTKVLSKLHYISFAILLLYLSFMFSCFIRNQLNLKLNIRINEYLMNRYYDKVLNLPKKFFVFRKDGEILSRFRDLEHIREAFSSIVITIVIDTFMLLIGTFILFFQNKELYLLLISMVIIYVILMFLFKNPFKKFNRMEMESQAVLSSSFIEGIRGIVDIKNYTIEKYYFDKMDKKISGYLNNLYKLNTVINAQVSFKSFLSLTTALVIIWYGAVQVIEGKMTLGELILFNVLASFYFQSIDRLIDVQPIIQSALVSYKRLLDILDLDIEKKEIGKNFSFNKCISFKDVSFSYNLTENILLNLNFTVLKNERVVIVGKSGSGKSTIANLLMSYYEVTRGKITLDNMNVNEIQLSELRKNIGYLGQQTFLFNESILKNLTNYTNKDEINYEEVVKACELTGIHDYISSLPRGYETIIESGGANLSVGQIQRIAMAKVLLKKPEIMILDEPTSSLDRIAAHKFLEIIKDIKCTSIIITHDKELVEMISEVIFIREKGGVLKGSHDYLLKNYKEYYDFWNSSFRKDL